MGPIRLSIHAAGRKYVSSFIATGNVFGGVTQAMAGLLSGFSTTPAGGLPPPTSPDAVVAQEQLLWALLHNAPSGSWLLPYTSKFQTQVR